MWADVANGNTDKLREFIARAPAQRAAPGIRGDDLDEEVSGEEEDMVI